MARVHELLIEKREYHNHKEYMKKQRSTDRATKRFIMWDGEGYGNHHYMLFGSSITEPIVGKDLTTISCLEHIIDVASVYPNNWHIGFAFEYDVNMILKDLSVEHLEILRDKGIVLWNGYWIEHVPNKWFSIKRRGVKRVKIFDVFSFFGCAYITALEKYNIGTNEQRELIRSGKSRRSQFTYDELPEVEKYWRCEISLGPLLMDRLRAIFEAAGFYINAWHGPAVLARELYKRYRIKDHQNECPSQVQTAARYAYSGGRFELFRVGFSIQSIFNKDIQSAYPFAATLLPSLQNGEWHHIVDPIEIQKIRNNFNWRKFAVWHIEYDTTSAIRADKQRHAKNGDFYNFYKLQNAPQPLFRRDKNGTITWPQHVKSWYWSPEASLVAKNKCAHFIEAWIFEDNGERPFAFLENLYRQRQKLKAEGKPEELTLKLGMNSLYGILAQKAGWQHSKGKPRTHQLEWAGFITSVCKMMVFKAAEWAWQNDALISIDTDGIFSTKEIPENILVNGSGINLGQWEDSRYSGILAWQSGLYWLRNTDGKWGKVKTRGLPRGSVPFKPAYKMIQSANRGNRKPIMSYKRSEFYGYRTSLRTDFKKWRTWGPKTRDMEFGKSPKRTHWIYNCYTCRQTKNNRNDDKPVELHWLSSTFPVRYDEKGKMVFKKKTPESVMYHIPWDKSTYDIPQSDELVVEIIE